MDERLRRVAQNEDIWRDVNELLPERDGQRVVFCECGRMRCTARLRLTADEYRRVRSSSVTFAIAPNHEIADFERVVERTDRFAIIEKTGNGRAVVDALDERTHF